MQYVSTRDKTRHVSFFTAITDCMPPDGGLYVPDAEEDFRQWTLYINEKTPFTSIAGSLTSALIHEEFSPNISEAIATNAFHFSPELRQLDDSLFLLELFHGPTGCYKDFGVFYLISCLEYSLLMRNKEALVVAVTPKMSAASLVSALRGKKRMTALLLFAKGTMMGFEDADCTWNGGNIFPVEVQGTEEDCFRLARELFARRDLVDKYGLTVANTANIGRILPETFLYTFAFSRLKSKINGDIFYALQTENHGNLVAGLYSWRLSLPVNGFITNCTPDFSVDMSGHAEITDAIIPLAKRESVNPARPSNLERLEDMFLANPAVIKGLVFPTRVTASDTESAWKELFTKYGLVAEPGTATAYAAAKKRDELIHAEDSATVLVSENHSGFFSQQIAQWYGEEILLPEEYARNMVAVTPKKCILPEFSALVACLSELKE
jgi:threonine synthase